MMRVAVIGAGPAGMTAAYELAKAGVEVEVFEASDCIGGLARSFELWDQTVDLGPHRFFSSDARVNRLWLEVVGRDYQMVDRLTRIYYRGKFFNYPLSAEQRAQEPGPGGSGELPGELCTQQAREPRYGSSKQPTTPASKIGSSARFGRRLFEIFFKTYSEKLWGIPCEELDADFAAQRIKKLSLGEAVKNALGLGGNKHRTLVDRFAIPSAELAWSTTGWPTTSAAWRRSAFESARAPRDARAAGEHEDSSLPAGEVHKFDHVISTMPLTLMVKAWTRCRSTWCVRPMR